mgnify:CR=1 FL=1
MKLKQDQWYGQRVHPRSRCGMKQGVQPHEAVFHGIHRLVKDLHTLGTLIVKLAPEMDKLNKDPSAFAQVQQDMPGITEKFQKTSSDLDAVMKSYAKHGYEFSKLSGITG